MAALKMYLGSLNKEHLNHVLNEVLTELRRRESEQIKKDVLTHSKSLRLNKGNSPPILKKAIRGR